MKIKFTRLFLFLSLALALNSEAKTLRIVVWDGYFKFMNHFEDEFQNIQVGDTIVWLPLDKAKTLHTITSSEIPQGAESFDFTYKFPNDTIFKYVVKVPGIYKFKCLPHESMEMLGEFEVLSVVSGISEAAKMNVSMFPNPASDYLRIENHNKDAFTAIINDINGKILMTDYIPGTSEKNLDISDLPAGNYVLQMRSSEIAESRVFHKK